MLFDYSYVFIFLVIGLVTVPLFMAIGRLIRPHNPSPEKLTSYECGKEPIGSAWIQFNLRFYTLAIIFIVFDVEVVFVYPIATVFRDWILSSSVKGWLAFSELTIFIGILLLGLVYAWKMGDLEWVKTIRHKEI